MRWTYLARDFLQQSVVWCSPTLFLLFLCAHPRLTMSLWKEFLSFKASTPCCFLQPSRYKDWSKTPGIFIYIFFSSMSFGLDSVTLNALCDEMNWRWPGESLRHRSSCSTSCTSTIIDQKRSFLTTTAIFQFNITCDIQTPKQGPLSHSTILETGICLWRARVAVWLLFGCTPEAVWVDWCERVQGGSRAQGRWTTELTTLG